MPKKKYPELEGEPLAERQLVYKKVYYQKNKEKILKKQKEWRENNKEYSKAYNNLHREERIQYMKAYKKRKKKNKTFKTFVSYRIWGSTSDKRITIKKLWQRGWLYKYNQNNNELKPAIKGKEIILKDLKDDLEHIIFYTKLKYCEDRNQFLEMVINKIKEKIK